MTQPLQILLTALGMLAVCYAVTLVSGCQKAVDRLESYLEVDEEVEVKFKVDFKDKAEQEAERGS